MPDKTQAANAAETKPDKPAAAKAETQKKGKKVKYRSVDLKLPPELPSTMLFDIVEIEAAGEGNPIPIFRMIRSLLGPDQFVAVRNAAADDPEFDVFELLNKVFDRYGLQLGE